MPIGLSATAVGAIAAGVSAATTAGTAIAGAVGQSGTVASGQAAANAAQEQALSNYTTNESPYISTGTNALSGLSGALGLNGANATTAFQGSPGFQFALGQGESAVDNGAASLGVLRTGNTVRAEQSFATGLADQNYNQYINQLSSLASTGQTATSALGNAGVQTGQGIAGTDTSAATAQANLTGATTKSVGNAVSSLAGNANVKNALSGLGSSPTSAALGTAASQAADV